MWRRVKGSSDGEGELSGYAQALVAAGTDSRKVNSIISSLTKSEIDRVVLMASKMAAHRNAEWVPPHAQPASASSGRSASAAATATAGAAVPTPASASTGSPSAGTAPPASSSFPPPEAPPNSLLHASSVANLQGWKDQWEKSQQMLSMMGVMIQIYLEKKRDKMSPTMQFVLDSAISFCGLLQDSLQRSFAIRHEIWILVHGVIYSLRQLNPTPLIFAALVTFCLSLISVSLYTFSNADPRGFNTQSIADHVIRLAALAAMNRKHPSPLFLPALILELIQSIISFVWREDTEIVDEDDPLPPSKDSKL